MQGEQHPSCTGMNCIGKEKTPPTTAKRDYISAFPSHPRTPPNNANKNCQIRHILNLMPDDVARLGKNGGNGNNGQIPEIKAQM